MQKLLNLSPHNWDQAIFNISSSSGWLLSDLSMETLLLSGRIQLSSELLSQQIMSFFTSLVFRCGKETVKD